MESATPFPVLVLSSNDADEAKLKVREVCLEDFFKNYVLRISK